MNIFFRVFIHIVPSMSGMINSRDDKLTPCLIEIKFLDNDHGYVPLVVNTSRSFPHSRRITGFVTRFT